MVRVMKLALVAAILTMAIAVPAFAIQSDDFHIGTSGNNTISGDSSDDYIAGLQGSDTLRGRGGEDSIEGGPGNDDIFGGRGDDVLDGGDGRDNIEGGSGDDTIDAADKQFDVVRCGTGRDVVFYDRSDVRQNCEVQRLAD